MAEAQAACEQNQIYSLATQALDIPPSFSEAKLSKVSSIYRCLNEGRRLMRFKYFLVLTAPRMHNDFNSNNQLQTLVPRTKRELVGLLFSFTKIRAQRRRNVHIWPSITLSLTFMDNSTLMQFFECRASARLCSHLVRRYIPNTTVIRSTFSKPWPRHCTLLPSRPIPRVNRGAHSIHK